MMKSLISVLAVLTMAMFASTGARAATVGLATFNAAGDVYSDTNVVINPTAFPFDYNIAANFTGNYMATLTNMTGDFGSLSLSWLGLQGPASVLTAGGSVTLTQFLTAGISPNPVVEIAGNGTGTFNLTITPSSTATTPIPAAMILLISGLGVLGFAAHRFRKPAGLEA